MKKELSRRAVLSGLALSLLSSLPRAARASEPVPIIDAHV
jgi:hypothetical protein